MASAKTLNIRNLVALGADRLAELLMDFAEGDAAMKRRLRLELASQSGGADVAAEIRKRLVEQVTGTVRWAESIAYMAHEGVDSFYELGSGKVLSGLVKRIADTATGTAVGQPADISAFAARPKS